MSNSYVIITQDFNKERYIDRVVNGVFLQALLPINELLLMMGQ